MTEIERAVVTATFLAGNCIELTAFDAIPPDDPENGDAEFYRMRAILVVARKLHRAFPSAGIHLA